MHTNKNTVLEKLIESKGNISEACKAAGIARRTFYIWKDDDPEFAEHVDEITESTIDAVEGYLMEQMKAGNPACIIFFLKTRAKHRGYVEKTEVENTIKGAKGKYILPDGTEIEI